jgi:hypothetical protein
MEARLIVCAQSVVIDQRSNAISLLNVFEELNVPAFPFAIAYMAVGMLLSREANEPSNPANITLRFYLGDEQIFRTIINPVFQQHLRMRHVVDIQAFVIRRPGVLRITVNQDEQELGEWKIYVNNIGPVAVVNPIPVAR